LLALKTVLSALLGGLLGLDAVQAFQFLLSRPAFVGTLLGWLNGCPLEGAKAGILLEMLYIDVIPVGGVVPPNGAAAAAVAVLAHSAGGLSPSLAFFAGAAAGAGFSPVEARMRAARSAWNTRAQAALEAGDLRLWPWLARGLGQEVLAMWAYVLAWTALAAAAAGLPGLARVYAGSDFAYSLMPVLGLSGLYFRFRAQACKKN
jgi:mannose/fructose/N-acetylgalactosamine-specific phosphotransferase system component IIC